LIDFLFNDFEWVGGVFAKKLLKTSLITIFIKKYNISVIIKKKNSSNHVAPSFLVINLYLYIFYNIDIKVLLIIKIEQN